MLGKRQYSFFQGPNVVLQWRQHQKVIHLNHGIAFA